MSEGFNITNERTKAQYVIRHQSEMSQWADFRSIYRPSTKHKSSFVFNQAVELPRATAVFGQLLSRPVGDRDIRYRCDTVNEVNVCGGPKSP